MKDGNDRRDPLSRQRERTDAFHQSDRALLVPIGLTAGLLALTLFAVLFGPGFEHGSKDAVWATLAALFLLALMAVFAWLLWRRPVVFRVGPAGLDLPVTFTRPLPWSQIHRIRRSGARHWHGRALWLVIDPSPGVLPDYRLPTWRRLELRFQRRHGVRVPLHALDAEPEAVVASIERFRPVSER